MIVNLADYSGFALGAGNDNSAQLNEAIWDVSDSSEGAGKVVMPSGHIEFHDNINLMSYVDLEGSGYRATTLHGVGAGLLANASPGTRINDFMSAEGEPTVYGTLHNSNRPDTDALQVRDVTLSKFNITRTADGQPGAAIMLFSFQNAGGIAACTRFSFMDWGINSTLGDAITDFCPGVSVYGGWSHRWLVPYIQNCYGPAVRIRNGDSTESLFPCNDTSFFGGEIRSNFKAVELINPNRFNWQGGTIQGNGRGLSIDGLARAIGLNGMWFETNNPSLIETNALLNMPYETAYAYHVKIGERDTAPDVDHDVDPPETVAIRDTRMTSNGNDPMEYSIAARHVGRNAPLNDPYMPGESGGGLAISNVSFKNNSDYPIKLLNEDSPGAEWDVKGYYENIANRAWEDSSNPLTNADICSYNNNFFNLRSALDPTYRTRKIVADGDSNTSGFPGVADPWTMFAEDGIILANNGVGGSGFINGWTAGSGNSLIDRLPTDLAVDGVEAICITGPSNDIKGYIEQYYSDSIYSKEYILSLVIADRDTITAAIRAGGVIPILCTQHGQNGGINGIFWTAWKTSNPTVWDSGTGEADSVWIVENYNQDTIETASPTTHLVADLERYVGDYEHLTYTEKGLRDEAQGWGVHWSSWASENYVMPEFIRAATITSSEWKG
jgi:hypothetical protein